MGLRFFRFFYHPPSVSFSNIRKSWKEMGRMEGKGVAGVYDTLFSIAFFEQPIPFFLLFFSSSLSFFSFLFSTRGMFEFKSKEEGNGREGGGEEDQGRSKGGKKMESREETCVYIVLLGVLYC